MLLIKLHTHSLHRDRKQPTQPHLRYKFHYTKKLTDVGTVYHQNHKNFTSLRAGSLIQPRLTHTSLKSHFSFYFHLATTIQYCTVPFWETQEKRRSRTCSTEELGRRNKCCCCFLLVFYAWTCAEMAGLHRAGLGRRRGGPLQGLLLLLVVLPAG